MAASFGGKKKARSIKAENLGAQLQAHAKQLHAFILRHLRNQADAKDVVQMVNERVVRYLDAGGAVNRLPQFMYRTARNLAIDKLRERDRNIIEFDSERAEADQDAPRDELQNDPYQMAEAVEKFDRLYRKLSPREKELLEYRMAGMTCDEIAAVTKFTRQTVETYLKRLRSACRAAWKGD